MKIYTKTGDKGTTGLYTGQRVDKDSLRVEAYGNIDEINSALGMARALANKAAISSSILVLQKMLMRVMADVASVGSGGNNVTQEDITKLEEMIDEFDKKLQPLNRFIIPGDNAGAAALDIARTTTRRAERQLWRLSRTESVDEQLIVVLNRLSDLCFTMSRIESELPSENS